jgi:hypothetical protein
MSERAEIEIDYCPTCRGVWLDRGELDKIIERALPSSPATQQPQQRQQVTYPPQHQSYYGQKKRKEHWLFELFD